MVYEMAVSMDSLSACGTVANSVDKMFAESVDEEVVEMVNEKAGLLVLKKVE